MHENTLGSTIGQMARKRQVAFFNSLLLVLKMETCQAKRFLHPPALAQTNYQTVFRRRAKMAMSPGNSIHSSKQKSFKKLCNICS